MDEDYVYSRYEEFDEYADRDEYGDDGRCSHKDTDLYDIGNQTVEVCNDCGINIY